MRILVVEDEAALCEAITEGLQIDGYIVDSCQNGQLALERVLCETYDLIVLDLNLPDKDGLEILTELRAQNNETKVLILSARASVSDKVLGLDIGANDYLAKPFAFEELEARVRNLLRRAFVQNDIILQYGDISLDTVQRTAKAANEILKLTRKELSLLEYFLQNQNRPISQEEFMEHVWDVNADAFSNAVRVHIASLRKKLKLATGRECICTQIGEGYYLSRGEEQC